MRRYSTSRLSPRWVSIRPGLAPSSLAPCYSTTGGFARPVLLDHRRVRSPRATRPPAGARPSGGRDPGAGGRVACRGEGSGHRRRRLHRLDNCEGTRGGRPHAGHPRLAPQRSPRVRARSHLLRGRHRRPAAAASHRRRAPRSRRHHPHGGPDRRARVGREALRVLPRQRRQVAGDVRRAHRPRDHPGALLLLGQPLRDQGGLRGHRGGPGRPGVAVRADQADDRAGPHRPRRRHRPARGHPALLQPDRLRPGPGVRHLRQGAVPRARPAGAGRARAEAVVHDHRHRPAQPRRHRTARLHPRLGPGPRPRARHREVRRGHRRGRRAEHHHQPRHGRGRDRPRARRVLRAGLRRRRCRSPRRPRVPATSSAPSPTSTRPGRLLGWSTELSIDEAISAALAWADRRQEILGYE